MGITATVIDPADLGALERALEEHNVRRRRGPASGGPGGAGVRGPQPCCTRRAWLPRAVRQVCSGRVKEARPARPPAPARAGVPVLLGEPHQPVPALRGRAAHQAAVRAQGGRRGGGLDLCHGGGAGTGLGVVQRCGGPTLAAAGVAWAPQTRAAGSMPCCPPLPEPRRRG